MHGSASGALSGAAMAVAGLLGRSLLPAMRRRGYDTQLSAGTILAGACLDPIIPPSVLAVVVATAADVSVGKMLIAGIIPGLLLTGMFLIYVLVRVHFNPKLAPDLVPAAALAARLLGEAGERRKAGRILERAWHASEVGPEVDDGNGGIRHRTWWWIE